MLNIPNEVKNLFNSDDVKKNFRASFISGKYPDICNDKVIADSVSFTESICSHDSFKLGLCEASTIEFDAYDIPNIRGEKIKCSIEVDCSKLGQQWCNDNATIKNDVPYPIYSIPYGVFIVESCPRDERGFRRVIAMTWQSDMDSHMNPVEKAKSENISMKNNTYNSSGTVTGTFDVTYNPSNSYFTYVNCFDLGEKHEFASYEEISGWTKTSKSYNHGTRYTPDGVGFDKVVISFHEFTGIPLNDDCVYQFEIDESRCRDRAKNFEQFKNDLTFAYKDDHPEYAVSIIEDETTEFGYFSMPAFKSFTSEGDKYASDKALLDGDHKGIYPFMYDGNNYSKTGWGTSGIDQILHIPYLVNLYMGDEVVKSYPLIYSGENKMYKVTISFDSGRCSYDRNSDPDTALYALAGGKVVSGFDSVADHLKAFTECYGKTSKISRETGNIVIYDPSESSLYPSESLFPSQTIFPMGSNGFVIGDNQIESFSADEDIVGEYEAIRVSWTDEDGYARENEMYYRSDVISLKDRKNAKVYDLDNYTIKNITTMRTSDKAYLRIREIKDRLFEVLKGITYNALSVTTRGLPYIESGDRFVVQHSNGSYKSIVLRRTLSGIQHLDDTYEAR